MMSGFSSKARRSTSARTGPGDRFADRPRPRSARGRWIFGLAIRQCETSSQCGSIRKASAATKPVASTRHGRPGGQHRPAAPPENRRGRQQHHAVQEHPVGPKPEEPEAVGPSEDVSRPVTRASTKAARAGAGHRAAPDAARPFAGRQAGSPATSTASITGCTAVSRGHCTRGFAEESSSIGWRAGDRVSELRAPEAQSLPLAPCRTTADSRHNGFRAMSDIEHMGKEP